MPEFEYNFSPFKNIGLCFSGGGYRATFYSLGVIAYLNHIKFKGHSLLDSVIAISSVSGGTILAAAYCNAIQQEDYNFSKFFKEMYIGFSPKNDKLLEHAIAKFKDDKVWKEHSDKRRTLINAFALTYIEMPLFKGTFNEFESDNIKGIEQLCFNATDFSYGLTFRFQNLGYLGNNPLHKSNQSEMNAVRSQIKLGDAIAASSCFPLGFSPIVFPDDFLGHKNNPAYTNLKSIEIFKDGVGIMDGGIADNQGIGSMQLINNRLKEKELDLFIVNDVASYLMQPWKKDDKKLNPSESLGQAINKILKYFSVRPIYWITFVFGLLLVIINSYLNIGAEDGWSALYILGSFFMGVGFVLTIIGLVSSIYKKFTLSSLLKLFKDTVPQSLEDDILSFQHLDVSLVKRMLQERITFSSRMINEVFLKQMRRLNYDLLYSKKDLKYRRLTTTIYKLNGKETVYTFKKSEADNEDDSTSDKKPKVSLNPSSLLEGVALTASKMPTTLWWGRKDIENNSMDA